MIPRPITIAGAAIVVAAAGACVAWLGHPAAGVVLVALAVAIACTALRLHLRQESAR